MILRQLPSPREVDPTLLPPAESNPIRQLISLLYIGLAAIALAFLGGCGIFSPEKGDGGKPTPPPPQYEVPFSPTVALENMRLAYEATDSVQAAKVYHPSYEGLSRTEFEPQTSWLTFTQADEIRHIGALRLEPSVTDIVLNMGLQSSWIIGPSLNVAHPEWQSITIDHGIQLQITTNSTLYTVPTNDFFQFQFAPTTPAAESKTDTTWQIIRWEEIQGAGS